MRYLNLAIFTLLAILYLVFSSHVKFSTNFIEIFFSQKSLKLFDIAKKLGISNEIYISKKGFDTKSLKELQEIAKKLAKIPEISKVETSLDISPKLREYIKKNYYLLADFNDTPLSKDEIKNRLKKIYEKIYNSVLYEPINTYDPLGLFHMSFKDGEKYLKLKNYGYIIKAKTSVNTADATQARVVYDKINSLLKNYPDTISFAPFYFLVENSAYIRGDAQKIMLIASILLLILYFIVLKNYKLFFNAIIAIASSVISAVLLSSLMFDSINILALVFGMSITSISIDYMFHYYFHGLFSKKKWIFQRRVFFGFLTTVGVFVIFSFISIELFAQLAFFSVISLSVAYALFSFVFPYLDIKAPSITDKSSEIKSFNPLLIAAVSAVMLVFVYKNLSFDNNLKNLDYHNTRLLKLSKMFTKSLQNDKYKAVIIEAKNQELLLQKYEKIEKTYPDMLGIGKFILSQKSCKNRIKKLQKYNFNKVKQIINKEARKIGFKDTFKNSYPHVEKMKCDMSIPKETRFKIIKEDNLYYTLALIKKESLKPSNLFEVVDLAKTLANDTKEMKEKLQNYMFISVAFIILVLLYSFGKEILYPLVYLLFPLSTVLFGISLIGKINIMHIFALVILLAISIDYGIYMHKTKTLNQTELAIKYALLSTFFGFGVLIFSKTTAMHSIGFVITVGIVSIFVLLYGKRVVK